MTWQWAAVLIALLAALSLPDCIRAWRCPKRPDHEEKEA